MDKRLLQKFKAGKCTPDEVRKILRWFQSEQAHSSHSVEIDDLWHNEGELPLPDKDDLFKQLIEKIHHLEHANKSDYLHQRAPIPKKEKTNFTRRLKLVAVIGLLLIASATLYFSQTQLVKHQPPVSENKMLSKVIYRGQKYTMKLSDGTLVKLNSGSVINYPEKFSDSLRVIEFEGEAYFQVAKDPARPFVIKSGKINTTVLGTSFNLKTKFTSEKFEVAVVTGSVKVARVGDENSLDERYLAPNQQAVFDSENNTFQIQAFDPDRVLAWVNGIIIFENSSLEEIKRKLENWYGVEIDTSGLTREISTGYTGSYKNKSLETVLDGISYVLDFKYEIRDEKVIIY